MFPDSPVCSREYQSCHSFTSLAHFSKITDNSLATPNINSRTPNAERIGTNTKLEAERVAANQLTIFELPSFIINGAEFRGSNAFGPILTGIATRSWTRPSLRFVTLF